MLRQKSRNDRFGFTLAEVLITLGIIGVVAALTLPALIATYEKQVTVNRLKKVYNQLNQVLLDVKSDYGDLQILAKKPSEFVPNTIAKYYNGVKVYPKGDYMLSMCYEETSYIGSKNPAKKALYAGVDKNGKSSGYISTPFSGDTVSIKLLDGVCIGFNQFVDNSKLYPETTIFVDVNGSDKKPNRLGRDLFFFTYDAKSETIRPSGWNIDGADCLYTSTDIMLRGSCCSNQIIKDGWKISKDYLW